MPNLKNTRSINQLFFFFLFLFLSACGNSSEQAPYISFSIQGNTQGTTYTIIADDEKLLGLQTEIDATLANFDKCLSSWRDSSIVNMISNADTGLLVFKDINGYFNRCFAASEEVYQLSDGAFDPSVFQLVSAWGFMKDPAISMS